MNLLENLLTGIKANSEVRDDISDDPKSISCIKCSYTVQKSKNCFLKLNKHFQTGVHKKKCNWHIIRIENNFRVQKHIQLISKFISRPIVQHQQAVDMEVAGPSDLITTPDYPDYSIDSDNESSLSADSFLDMVATTSTPNGIAAQTVLSGKDMDNSVETFLRKDLNMALRSDFKLDHLVECMQENPLIKSIIENNLQRRHKNAPHNPGVKEHFVKYALKFTMQGAHDISAALGGPKLRTLQNACKATDKILPFLSEENIEDHFRAFKNILLEEFTSTSIENIPVQASFDATPVTGRLNTRNCDKEFRLLYGINCPEEDPFMGTYIVLELDEAKGILLKSGDKVTINGLQSVTDLFRKNKITRATSYMVIILTALVDKPKPYCVGLYPVGKGHSGECLLRIQRFFLAVAKNVGIRVVNISGDGDPTLRSIQWGKLFIHKRGLKLNNDLTILIDLWYNSSSTFPIFTIQDPLHCLKKCRNNVKYTETRCLMLGVDPDREEQLVVRWDYILDLVNKDPNIFTACTLSAINLTDRQDPSLVSDLSSCYKFFLQAGYFAMGIYMKALQLLCEAFLDQDLTPYERVSR